MALKQISSNKCFGGLQKVFEHDSVELNCKMKFAIYLPPKAETGKCPALYWLSGLTCTEQNFISKAGYHQAASEHGLVVIAPDTSPRGCNIKGEDESWDFGTGAGFYVDATEDPWKTNYRMYSYVTEELPQLINANFPVDPQKMSIFGHSMGGHGALICALKNPGKYKSVSAFAPICNPVLCPWGKKAFSGYLGTDQSKWKAYDATHLVKSYPGSQLDILIDQGKDDQFLSDGQLLPDNFIAACTEKKFGVAFHLGLGEERTHCLGRLLVRVAATAGAKGLAEVLVTRGTSAAGLHSDVCSLRRLLGYRNKIVSSRRASFVNFFTSFSGPSQPRTKCPFGLQRGTFLLQPCPMHPPRTYLQESSKQPYRAVPSWGAWETASGEARVLSAPQKGAQFIPGVAPFSLPCHPTGQSSEARPLHQKLQRAHIRLSK
ncbi:hypothetical protein GH733_006652 [Mirounga leonina]|nr:hypothetical protein GH733_006652 [Mirounga leonina]